MLYEDIIMTGDILAFKPRGWLGKAIKFFSSGKYSHIAVVYSKDQIFEMGGDVKNAEAIFRNVAELAKEAKDVDVFRVQMNRTGSKPYQENPALAKLFKQTCQGRKGQPYDFGRIVTFAFSGLLMKVPGLAWLTRQYRRTDANPMDKQDVCSALGREVVQIPIRKEIDPNFDLLPSIGVNRSRPADFPHSPHLIKVC